MKVDIVHKLDVPEVVTVTIDGSIVVKGPKGEVSRAFQDPRVMLSLKDNKVILESKSATRREKKRLFTFAAHISNMMKGVVDKHVYELKICAAHFPMNVTVSGNVFVIKNFLGENTPRVVTIPEGVTVKVNGDVVVIESTNKEDAGMMASKIELLTRVRNRDRRIFQDGIFIINKCGKSVL